MRPTLDGVPQEMNIKIVNSAGDDLLQDMTIGELRKLVEEKRARCSSYGAAMYIQAIEDEIFSRHETLDSIEEVTS
tara:strand:+ start:81 stop:308 length:228 start_codon:yes stop_codon:yes gene_type:complete